jgi:two-component system, sensor histidine kinase and response regulator
MNFPITQPFKADILVVDDTPENLKLLSKILTDAGYKVRPVTNGKRALDAIDINPPDLILLDILMPDMDGYEVCRILKTSDTNREIPVIFLTALNDATSQVKGFELGALDYITKPFDEQTVLARIENQLTIKRQKSELQEEIIYRQQLETQLRYAKEMAEQANRAKSVFIANMSHELRTPMNAIIGFAELMKTDPALNSDYQEYMEIIYESGQYLLSLINGILDLAKIEAQQIDLNRETFSLNDMINHLKAIFEFKANKQNIRFVIKRDSQLPEVIESDEKKLRQILINLLGNAFKFTEQGQVTLRLKVVDSAENILAIHSRDRAELRATVAQQEVIMLFEVIDTGPGIAPENFSKIFQPFVQTEVGKKVPGGTGLGLSISQKFAELLGGELTVNSVVGQGSSFQCYLPVMVPKTDKFFSLVQPVKLKPHQEIYRILVVDDEPTNRFLLVEFLKGLEVEVRSVENGMQAIAEAMTWLPHLIWMDIRMPIINGYEATKKIREFQTDAAPKIIAMTANPLELEENSIFQSEFDDFVGKPFTQKTIFAKMADHLGINYVGKC